MKININNNSEEPKYVQIYNQIVNEIVNGLLVPGDKLPPTRKLCAEINASLQTIKTAYNKLVYDGYVISRTGSGYYVSAERAWDEKPPKIEIPKYIFSPNGVETSKLPFAKWSELLKDAIKEDIGLFQLGDKEGEWCLRKSIRRLLYRTQNIHCKTNQIIIGPGKFDLLRDIFYVLGRDKKVFFSNYCDFPIVNCADYVGCPKEYIYEDRNGIDVAALNATDGEVLYISPTCNNTTGAETSQTNRQKIALWGTDNQRFVIEDSYDNDYQYAGKQKTIFEINKGKNIIYLGEFSRTIFPSMKIGYAVLPNELLDLWLEKLCPYSCRVSRPEQVALSKFIDVGEYERHIEYMKKTYKNKINTLIDNLQKSALWDCADTWGTNTGSICNIHFNLKVSEAEARASLLQDGVKLSTINAAHIGSLPTSFPENSYRIGLGHMKPSDIRAAVKIWERCWEKFIL